MSLSIYQASIPVFIRMLGNLSAILAKAAAHAEAKSIDPSVLINARLAPDMFPLARQVQIASDSAKGCGARLAGVDVPGFPDDETTFEQLQARIAKTIEFLKSLKEDQFTGAENRTIELQLRGREVTFKGSDFLLGFANPNFYFHITTAYDILRHNGVEVGKTDFLGGV
ncbi:DUF1993 family protein [Pseudomonas sp. ZM23]|uniref:DUF1993 family protein n=1 Tax=Pseudomonas triclosanedens TaxID=2961893 RepID=A0ABY6ZRU2_9PSED|nr:DUF1993 family protein [Pseudomonas triclosanedens]MCP8466109.1 DUF1993 family protein [Pseudomonas triclosanedens]MCP8472344.1 DUF1993 family protein [Pseudomonas triclosanedens]MCP8477408.1 DUF1993 family protein [Pseudomonas triclosanedens]WAI47257.1 DUF1993 family protein [Pseudomonas triclosanedens]